MDEIDLDLSVQEIEEEKGHNLPKIVIIIARILIIIILVVLALILLFKVHDLVSWIADANYVPSEEELNQPREPLTIFEIEKPFDITLMRDGVRIKINVEEVILAYEQDNYELPQIMNTKGPNIARIVRDVISEQKTEDLMDSKRRNTVVKENILLGINKYLVGVEMPTKNVIGRVKEGAEVRILDVALKDKSKKSLDEHYIKVKIVGSNLTGWVPISKVQLSYDLEPEDLFPGLVEQMKEESQLFSGEKKGGIKGVTRGIIDVYFPKGFRVLKLC